MVEKSAIGIVLAAKNVAFVASLCAKSWGRGLYHGKAIFFRQSLDFWAAASSQK